MKKYLILLIVFTLCSVINAVTLNAVNFRDEDFLKNDNQILELSSMSDEEIARLVADFILSDEMYNIQFLFRHYSEHRNTDIVNIETNSVLPIDIDGFFLEVAREIRKLLNDKNADLVRPAFFPYIENYSTDYEQAYYDRINNNFTRYISSYYNLQGTIINYLNRVMYSLEYENTKLWLAILRHDYRYSSITTRPIATVTEVVNETKIEEVTVEDVFKYFDDFGNFLTTDLLPPKYHYKFAIENEIINITYNSLLHDSYYIPAITSLNSIEESSTESNLPSLINKHLTTEDLLSEGINQEELSELNYTVIYESNMSVQEKRELYLNSLAKNAVKEIELTKNKFHLTENLWSIIGVANIQKMINDFFEEDYSFFALTEDLFTGIPVLEEFSYPYLFLDYLKMSGLVDLSDSRTSTVYLYINGVPLNELSLTLYDITYNKYFFNLSQLSEILGLHMKVDDLNSGTIQLNTENTAEDSRPFLEWSRLDRHKDPLFSFPPFSYESDEQLHLISEFPVNYTALRNHPNFYSYEITKRDSDSDYFWVTPYIRDFSTVRFTTFINDVQVDYPKHGYKSLYYDIFASEELFKMLGFGFEVDYSTPIPILNIFQLR